MKMQLALLLLLQSSILGHLRLWTGCLSRSKRYNLSLRCHISTHLKPYQVKFDTATKDIYGWLEALYPIGNNPLFPDKWVYHHNQKNGWYFELTNLCLTSWTNNIVSILSDLSMAVCISLPLGSRWRERQMKHNHHTMHTLMWMLRSKPFQKYLQCHHAQLLNLLSHLLPLFFWLWTQLKALH